MSLQKKIILIKYNQVLSKKYAETPMIQAPFLCRIGRDKILLQNQ